MLIAQELQGKTADFRRRLKAGAALDSLLVEGESPSAIMPRTDSSASYCSAIPRRRLTHAVCRIYAIAFAVVRESSWRVLGQRHFDVQLMGGLALHEGRLAEMATGEGKTLAAMLPTYLNALSGTAGPFPRKRVLVTVCAVHFQVARLSW